jgi:hypothetical protein
MYDIQIWSLVKWWMKIFLYGNILEQIYQ